MFDIDRTGKRIISKPKQIILSELNEMNIDLLLEISRFKSKESHKYISIENIDIKLTTSLVYKIKNII